MVPCEPHVGAARRDQGATAARLAGQAEASAAAGQIASARSGFFRASNYFRTAGLFAMGSPVDPRLTEAHRREVESFRRGAALLDVPPEIVQIPYEGTSLPAYFFRAAADATPRPTVILTNGYDGTAEELYFTNGAAALERGYNVLAASCSTSRRSTGSGTYSSWRRRSVSAPSGPSGAARPGRAITT
jgi:S-formylglutathione hydrolase FrmB